MDSSVALSAFSLLFLAEMGDKSQLLAMTLAHRYRVASVVAGTFTAFAVLNLLAVLMGQALFELVPQEFMLLTAGGLFLYFGYRFWQNADGAEEDEANARPDGSGVVTSFTIIFVAELGDKTQLTAIALAAGTGDIWAVFAGGTLAVWAVSLIGILFGATLLRKIPKRQVHRAAALMFIIFGVLAIGQVMLNGNHLVVA
jgi:putative Ca2+/H+ antiporter (TMEM165/GDT1 family)